MSSKLSRLVLALIGIITFTFAGCGGSGGGSSTPTSQNGTVNLMVSDDPMNDWAAVDVKILSIALNPSGGGAAVTVYTAPSGTMLNLVELDQIAEILGNISVPAGTYASATLTLSGNPGNVILTASEDPDTGFAGTPGATVPASQVQIQGTTGSVGSLTVPLTINFVSNLVVSANSDNALDLEFDLSHPAFIVAHNQPTAAATLYAVNFNGPWVRHHPIADITRLVLRDLYGDVDTVAASGLSMSVTKVYPVEPAAAVLSAETPIVSSQMLTINVDAVNGTILHDLDAGTTSTVFVLPSSLDGKYVRVAARYGVSGTLTAVRIWASSTFGAVFNNPEGHVLHVDNTNHILTVEKENTGHVSLQVVDGANPTLFYFRTPANAQADATAIGSGTAFLTNLKRGFKVHVLANPLTSPPTAVTVDIEVARFEGKITNPSNVPSGGFDYTRVFPTTTDTYTNFALTYISPNTANGKDPLSGGAISGFKWWNFAFPTLVTSNVTDGTEAQTIIDFYDATNDAVNFGGTVGSLPAYGTSGALWGDPANITGWSAPWAILVPSPVPLGNVSIAYSNGTGTFTMTVPGGTDPVTVDVNATPGSATLVYDVFRNGSGIVTISPVDITTTGGLAIFEAAMVNPTTIKVAGLPESNGHIKAYVILYFTGTMPTS